MHVEVVSLFPTLLRDALRYGVLARAVDRALLTVGFEDLRAHPRAVCVLRCRLRESC